MRQAFCTLLIAAIALLVFFCSVAKADPVNVTVNVSPQISGCCSNDRSGKPGLMMNGKEKEGHHIENDETETKAANDVEGGGGGNGSCPCVDEIRAIQETCRTPRDPTLGPDFDNDPNWLFLRMADFMNEEEMRLLPTATFENSQEPTTPYTLERERPIAVSPEGRMYLWVGAITDFGDEFGGPAASHPGATLPPFESRPLPDEQRGNCLPLSELEEGRATAEGNGVVLNTLPGVRIVSAPFTFIGGAQTPFTPGGFEVASDHTLRIHEAVKFEFASPKVRAVVLNGLQQLDTSRDAIVNLGIGDNYLHAGAFPAIAAPPSRTGYEVHQLDAAAGRYVIMATNPGDSLSSILLGNFAVSDICLFDSIDEDWYLTPLLYLPSLDRKGRDVIGQDERDRYNPTNYYPVRVLGAIHSPNGDMHYCSGSKVGPRHFLTAGHCMFNKDTKKWIPNARIWFGQNGDGTGLPPTASQAPYGIKKHSWYYSVVGWFEDLDWRYDYGMIVLQDEPQTVSLGWLGYASDWTMSLAGNTVNLLGHPGSTYTCAASPKANKQCGGYLYGDSGAIWFQLPYHLYYKIDTNPGNSGSAVYYLTGGHRYVVGIHAYGTSGDALNKAVRIRGAVFDNIKSWINQWPSAYD